MRLFERLGAKPSQGLVARARRTRRAGQQALSKRCTGTGTEQSSDYVCTPLGVLW